MTNRILSNKLLTNKLLYDHYRNIKLLELYPNQNKELGFESLNYGYDGLEINYNFDYKELNFEIDYGTEGFVDTVKDLASRFWKWLKELLNKIYSYIKKLFIKVLNFLKELLYKALGIKEKNNNNIKFEKPNIIKEKISKLKEQLENKKIKILSYKDFNSIFELFYIITKNIKEILVDHITYIINNMDNSGNIKRIDHPFKYLSDNHKIDLSNISDNLKQFLFGEKDDYAEEINGIQALTIATPNDKTISILNANTSEEVEKGYNELVELIKKQIKLLEEKYLPFIEKVNTINITENEFTNAMKSLKLNYYENVDNPNLNNRDDDIPNGFTTKRLGYIYAAINTYIGYILHTPNNIITRNISVLTPFYNEVLRNVVNIFKDIHPLETVEVFFKSRENIEKMFNKLKGKEFYKINEMPIYLMSTIHKEFITSTDMDERGMFNYAQNTYGSWTITLPVVINTFILLGDGLLSFMPTKDAAIAICAHEYNHYKKSYNTKSILKIYKDLFSGKILTEIQDRNIEFELDCDLYGAKYTSPNIMLSAIKGLMSMQKSRNVKDNELLYRFKFMEYVKQHGLNISIKEYLSNNKYTTI